MRKIRFCLLVLAVLLTLAACTGGEEPSQTTAAPTTEPAVPVVDIGGTELEYGVTSLDLGSMDYELDKLLSAARVLDQVTRIDLGVTDLRAEALQKLEAAYPNAEIVYTIHWMDRELNKQTTSVNLSKMTPADTDALLELLPMLPRLERIEFVDDMGNCNFTAADLDQLDRIREARPEIYLRVSFELFGQTVTSETERIEYYCVDIGNEGAEVVFQHNALNSQGAERVLILHVHFLSSNY